MATVQAWEIGTGIAPQNYRLGGRIADFPLFYSTLSGRVFPASISGKGSLEGNAAIPLQWLKRVAESVISRGGAARGYNLRRLGDDADEPDFAI